MPLAVLGISHAPLIGFNDPDAETLAQVEHAFDTARAFVADFDPELVVLFAPDHYNGVFYDLMPQFCIAMAANSVGDWNTTGGPIAVDREAARDLAKASLNADLDVAISERLEVDHGFAQPLDVIFGGIDRVATVPIFINSVAAPLGPIRRARALGAAVGEAAARLDRRVLLIGSGGLSHDPPIPELEGAPADVAERLIAGRGVSPAARKARETMVTRTSAEFVSGTAKIMSLNMQWDEQFLDILASGQLSQIDAWENDDMTATAGHACHEVRTWLAAYSALATQGGYSMTSRFYKPIPEWIAGFAVTTAIAP